MTQFTDNDTAKILQKLDGKLDAIASDIVEIKITQAKHGERFNGIDQRLDAMEKKFDQRLESVEEILKTQDTKIWGLVAGIVLALFGLLAKLAFFPVTRL